MRARLASRNLPRVCSKCKLAISFWAPRIPPFSLRYDSLDRAVKEAPSGVTDTKVQKFVNGIVMTEKIMLQVPLISNHPSL